MTMRHERPRVSPVPILMYHSISDQAAPGFRRFTVTPRAFAEQMDYLAEHGNRPVTVTQLAEAIRGAGEPLPAHPVVLTFDDGFADFHSQALPVLKSNVFTATLYVCTAFVGDTGRWLRREGEANRPVLTWEQLGDIAACGIEIGAHGHTHRALDRIPASQALDEIVRPREILGQRLACRISSFAYPFGYYSREVRQFVVWAGYSSACAVRYDMSSTRDDPFALARLIVTRNTDMSGFARLLEGGWMPGMVVRRAGSRLRGLARRALLGDGYRVLGGGRRPRYPAPDTHQPSTKGY